MSYLITRDYYKLIQADNLAQIIGSDMSILNSIQVAAQAEAISYLTQKYITTQEFTDTSVYNSATLYKANDRVYLDAAPYDGSKTYTLHSLTLHKGSVYACSTAISAQEVFTLGHWTLIGPQFTMYFVTLPYPEFNYKTTYLKTNQVYWNNKTYTCQIASSQFSHDDALQAGYIGNIPLYNVFPDDPVKGVQYWGVGTAYALVANTLPSDTTKWTLGDNRNPQLVNYCVDIALYHTHSRIAPRNIPELRVKRYDDAIDWLCKAGQGKITADLPVIQPRSGNRIRFGGNVKQVNSYDLIILTVLWKVIALCIFM